MTTWPIHAALRSGVLNYIDQFIQGFPQKIGELRHGDAGLTLTRKSTPEVRVELGGAVHARLTRWPHREGDATEVGLRLHAAGGPALAVRSVLPSAVVADEVRLDRALEPFVAPEDFLALVAVVRGAGVPLEGIGEVAAADVSGLESEGKPGSCVSCSSMNLISLGHMAYQCRGCGYEGGGGMADLLAQRRSAFVESLGPAERRRRAEAELRAVLVPLRSGADDLEKWDKDATTGFAIYACVMDAADDLDDASLLEPAFAERLAPLRAQLNVQGWRVTNLVVAGALSPGATPADLRAVADGVESLLQA